MLSLLNNFITFYEWHRIVLLVGRSVALSLLLLSSVTVSILLGHRFDSSKFEEITLTTDQVQQCNLTASGESNLTENQCIKLAGFFGMQVDRLCITPCYGGGGNDGVFVVQDTLVKSDCLVFKKLLANKEKELCERIRKVAGSEGLGSVVIKERKSFPLVRTYGLIHWGNCGCIEVMEVARGKTLCKIFNDLPEYPSAEEKQLLQQAFYEAGHLMGKVHKVNMKNGRTVVHGDCHVRNMFFDVDTGEAKLIDAEKSVFSMLPNSLQPPVYDVIMFIFHPLFFSKGEINILHKDKLVFSINAFMRGYASSFSESEWKFVSLEIKKIVNLCFQAGLIVCKGYHLEIVLHDSLELNICKTLELPERYTEKLRRLWKSFIETIRSDYQVLSDKQNLCESIIHISEAIFDGV